VEADAIAHHGEDQRLVEDHPALHAVAEGLSHDVGVICEAPGGVAVRPAAGVFQGLGEVPVIECGEGPDSGCEQLVDQPAVVVDALGVCAAAALGLDLILPFVCVKRSQIDSPLPSSRQAPSIW